MKHSTNKLVLSLTASILAAGAAHAADSTPPSPTPSASWQKPAWLTDLSLGVKESYDDNVLGVSDAGPLAKQSSWVSTISPKVGFNFAPLLGDQKVFQVLSVAYLPDFVAYHDDSVESYNAQRIAGAVKGSDGPVSFSLDNLFTYIDGSRVAPTYTAPDNFRSGFAGAMPLARRKQIQDRANAAVRYDWEKFFLRPTASLMSYDLMTDLRTTPGYQNYTTRSDVNGGLDAGYKLTENTALTIGYRYGSQYQQALPSNIDPHQYASVNNYQRILFGFEGKPWSWLTVSYQGGPDFRTYGATAAVQDHNMTVYYGEGTLTADVTAKDSFSVKYKQWQWVCYTGKSPYYDSNGELNYHRKVTKDLSLDLGGRIGCADFNPGYGALGNFNKKKDFLYVVSAGVNYSFTQHLSATATYALNLGRNGQNDLGTIPLNSKYRSYEENVVSLGLTYKF